ncbi:DUF6902 family protein [Roseovarius amoyensis]|uniref:DUF6902 family protein n=1 Tax=Roseovarius amoyensis TaxID=2211448 RepID=UPI000DBE589B|nr:hypothetical protein [Roseovarius amoyensis]
MGDILQLDMPFRQRSRAARQVALIDRVASARRGSEDVFWLKENAELLNVLESTKAAPGTGALAAYEGFYRDIEARIGFFPQYYRFFLSICLDLEDLGLGGDSGDDKAVALAEWVASQGLVGAELSDLQRAEARRLCLRRGVDPLAGDHGLDDRLRAFARRSATFALPNKKAAYELTHIIFYLSEYGRRDPGADAAMIESLCHTGTLAFLELNIDLLSEVCIALRFAGATPPPVWERWLADQANRFQVLPADRPGGMDDYHPWLMLNWFMALSGRGGFAHEMPQGAVVFAAPEPNAGPLRELSDCMYKLRDARSPDWDKMRDRVGDGLSDEARNVLAAAEEAVDFSVFFRGFARAGGPGLRPGAATVARGRPS